jgi:hypothetical protein
MAKTRVKQVFNGIMYYLDDSEPPAKEKRGGSTIFNFGTNGSCLCCDIMLMEEVKPNYVVECNNKVYFIKNIRYNVRFVGDTQIEGVLLQHNKDIIFCYHKPTFFTKNVECYLLCHTFEEFNTKWMLYGYKK